MNDFKGRHFGGEVVLWAVRGFKTLETAYGTIKGFEVMRALRKGQARIFALQGGVVGEARIVERAFGLGPCPLTEAIVWLQGHLASAETRDEPLSLPGHPRLFCRFAAEPFS